MTDTTFFRSLDYVPVITTRAIGVNGGEAARTGYSAQSLYPFNPHPLINHAGCYPWLFPDPEATKTSTVSHPQKGVFLNVFTSSCRGISQQTAAGIASNYRIFGLLDLLVSGRYFPHHLTFPKAMLFDRGYKSLP